MTPLPIIGYRFGLAAFGFTVAFAFVQLLQLVGVLTFPLDEILIYATSLGIVVPFVLEMVAFHHLTDPSRRFWSHGAVLFAVIYAVFVTANYVVQLATVIPAKIKGQAPALLEQTPHSMFWNYDAIGYIAMALAMLLAVPALDRTGADRHARLALLANVCVTPLICVVYFSPGFSTGLLLLATPWAITAPLAMLMLARAMRSRRRPVGGG